MSLLLRANTDILRLVTGSAADVEPHVSALQADSAAPPAMRAIPNYGPLASITTATTTNLVDTSGLTANDTVNVLGCVLHNNHGSTSTTARVEVTDGTNTVVLANVTLLAGERLELGEDGRWLHYDSNGGLYPSVGNAASQAEMEAGTATDKYVTPNAMKWHPGVAKAWGVHAVSGGVPQMTSTFNVTSVTDSGVSRVTPVIATDFSSSTGYSVQATAQAATTTYSATTTCLIIVVRNATPTVTQFTLDLLEIDIGQATDPAAWYWAAFGDQ